MERSGNFYKAIRLGYILISILIGCMAYNSLYEWQEIEALELGNKKIDELRKEINNINIQMIKFSLLGETILEWNDKDIEHYHARRMAMDSMLCRFKATYPAERIDSVRSLLEDKERQMFQIVRLMDEQQSINPQIRNYAHHIMNWWSKSTSYPSPSFSCPVDNRQLRSSVFSLSAVLKS